MNKTIIQSLPSALYLLLISSLPLFLFGQNKKFQLHLYGFEDGLTHRNVYKIQQDTNGFIWIATINGLNKFDGHQFIQYHKNNLQNNIPEDYITDLLIDKSNNIWLAAGEQLAKMNPIENTYQIIQQANKSITKKHKKRHYNLFQNTKGHIFVNTFLEDLGQSWFQYYDGTKLKDAFAAEGDYADHPIEEFKD